MILVNKMDYDLLQFEFFVNNFAIARCKYLDTFLINVSCCFILASLMMNQCLCCLLYASRPTNTNCHFYSFMQLQEEAVIIETEREAQAVES